MGTSLDPVEAPSYTVFHLDPNCLRGLLLLAYDEDCYCLHRKELEKVYKELYSGFIVKQKHALGRVSVWKSRAVHKLPVAVESTAAFVSASMECNRAGAATGEDLRLRRLCSFALMRFVNHITEKRQSAMYAQPIHRLAAELGVPEWIVDLRHEATHGELPSLSVLRVATTWCLQWLKREFWELQLADPADETDQTDTEDTMAVNDLLVSYQQHKYTGLPQSKYHSDLNRMLQDNGSAVCAVLSQKGYLVFTASQLTSLKVTQEEILNGDLLLPAKIVEFWRPLLQKLINYDLVVELLYQLTAKISEERSLANKFLIGWIYTMMWHNLRPRKTKDSLFRSQLELPYKQLLDVCALKLNPFSVQLIDFLLGQIDDQLLSAEKKDALRQLMNVYYNKSAPADMDNGVKQLQTVEDIGRDSDHVSTGRWARCTESIDWSKYALGVLPNQVLDYECLEISNKEKEELSDMDCTDNEDSISNTRFDMTYSTVEMPGTRSWNKATVDSITCSVLQEVIDVCDSAH